VKNNGIVNIHGRDYMTVAKRVELAHADNALENIETEVVSHDPVVIRARVSIKGKSFTGISSISLDSAKQIERQNPYEVAETSAVGRALGFAGYGVIEGIPSADEMFKSQIMSRFENGDQKLSLLQKEALDDKANIDKLICEVCGKVAVEKRGITKGGKAYHGVFCSSEDKSHTKWLWN
jgi:hypothetical protein